MNHHAIEKSRAIWIAKHRDQGHQPYAAPTPENPEQWECKCDADAVWTAVWRILTVKQIQQKFAHLRNRVPPGSTVLDTSTGDVYQEPGKWGT